jgi:ferredoxin
MAKVNFVMDELSVEVLEGSRLLQIAKDSGSSIPFGCTNGVCGTCITKVVEGNDNLSAMELREQDTLEMFGADDGEHRLACQCRVNGDVTLDNP